MRCSRPIAWIATAVGTTLALPGGAAELDLLGPGDTVMVYAAPDSIHFHPRDTHTKYSWALGAEWQRPSRWLAGYSYFNNSFGQKSQYYYGGMWWPLGETDQRWYLKLTGGVLVGYEYPYEDQVPYNHNGVSPGIIPALGYKMNRYSVQLNLLGFNGMIITFGYDLIRK